MDLTRTQGLVTPDMLRRAGLAARLHRYEARSEVVRVRPGVYGTTALENAGRYLVTDRGVDPLYLRQVRAALLSLGGEAFARGRTAAVLHGWPLLVEPRRVLHLGVPHGRGRGTLVGARITQHRSLDARQLVVVPGTDPVRVTSPHRTVVDACCTLPLLQAVVLTDSALRAGSVSVASLMTVARRLTGVRGARRVRQVIDWADPCSGSVLESVQRVRMRQAGLIGFRTQVELAGPDGTRVLRVDFCFDDARLVVEVDGQRWHPDPAVDRGRDNLLVAAGWRVLRFSWAEVVHDSERVIGQIRSALCASLARTAA